MPETSQNWSWYIAGAVILFLGVGGLWYLSAPGAPASSNANGEASTTDISSAVNELLETGAESVTKDGYTIERVPIEDAPPAPSLNRPIPEVQGMSASVRAAMLVRINEDIEMLKKAPDSFDHWIDLGLMRKNLTDYEGAKEAWEYVSILFPKNVPSFANLGELYANYLKDYPAAEKNYKRAIQNDVENHLNYRNLFEFYRDTYKPASTAAEDTLKEGIAKFPQALDLYVLLARYYRDSGRTEEARSTYDAAIAAGEKAGNGQFVAEMKVEKNSL